MMQKRGNKKGGKEAKNSFGREKREGRMVDGGTGDSLKPGKNVFCNYLIYIS